VNAEAHRAYRDELAAYTIGALEPAEVDELERHVSGCGECREYLFWLDPAVDLLPASVDQLQAPRRLKRALMAEVHDDLKAARRAERDRERAERGFWGSIWRPATAIAACLVLVAGIVGGYALRGDDEPQSDLIVAQVLDEGVGARTAATLEREGDRGILHVEALPPLPENRVYQAWIQRDGAMEPSTAFVVGRDGTTEVAIKGSLDGASGIYVTREPADGSEEPSLPVIMKAPLA
jgi:anti-sigma-K factor RskA